MAARSAILRGLDRQACVPSVSLEREALHLQAKQLELGDVASLGPHALKTLDLVQGREILLGQRERRLRDEHTGESALDLQDDHEPSHVVRARGRW